MNCYLYKSSAVKQIKRRGRSVILEPSPVFVLWRFRLPTYLAGTGRCSLAGSRNKNDLLPPLSLLPHGTVAPVLRSYWPFWPEGREHLVGMRWRRAIMSLATEILSPGRDQFSSRGQVARGMGVGEGHARTHLVCAVMLSAEAADMVLLNISSSCCRRIERTDEDSWNPSFLAIFA